MSRIDEILLEFQKVDRASRQMLNEVIKIKDEAIRLVEKDVEHHKEIYLNMEVQRDTVILQKDKLDKDTSIEIGKLKEDIMELKEELKLARNK